MFSVLRSLFTHLHNAFNCDCDQLKVEAMNIAERMDEWANMFFVLILLESITCDSEYTLEENQITSPHQEPVC